MSNGVVKSGAAVKGLLSEGFTVEEIDSPLQSLLEARIAQQELVDAVEARTIAVRGSAAPYIVGGDGRPSHVWYASYGSNMARERMLCYLEGGSPRGSEMVQVGARNSALPVNDVPVRLPGSVFFSGRSRRWQNGGGAFYDPTVSGVALGRAYLLTMEQFDDVVAQECGLFPGDKTVDVGGVLRSPDGRLVEPGLYGTLVHVGDLTGFPVLSFTGPFSAAEAKVGGLYVNAGGALVSGVVSDAELGDGAREVFWNAPSVAYRELVGLGLRETFGFSDVDVETYFAGAAGAAII